MRQAAREHLKEHDPQGIEVAPWVNVSPEGLLRRAIAGGPEDGAEGGELGFLAREIPRKPKVSELHLARLRE